MYLLNWIIEETTHNPEVAGSSPVPAPIRKTVFRLKYGLFLHFLKNFMEFYLWMKSCFDPDLAPTASGVNMIRLKKYIYRL